MNPTAGLLFQSPNKIFNRQISLLFRENAVQENYVNSAAYETGSSVQNRASRSREASISNCRLCQDGVNETDKLRNTNPRNSQSFPLLFFIKAPQ